MSRGSRSPSLLRRSFAGAVGVIALAGLAACGGASTGMSQHTRSELSTKVAEVRTALESSQPELAAQRLAEFRGQVTGLRSRDRITDDTATRLLAAAVAVETRLSSAPITTTTTTSTTSPPVRDDAEDGTKNNEGKGKGKGAGKDD